MTDLIDRLIEAEKTARGDRKTLFVDCYNTTRERDALAARVVRLEEVLAHINTMADCAAVSTWAILELGDAAQRHADRVRAIAAKEVTP